MVLHRLSLFVAMRGGVVDGRLSSPVATGGVIPPDKGKNNTFLRRRRGERTGVKAR